MAETFYAMFTVDRTIPHDQPVPGFVCDSHLGALARLLRLMGFHTLWQSDWTEPAILRLVVNEGRVALSRSRSLMARHQLRGSLLLTDDRPDGQAAEVLRVFGLADRVELWGRCTRCNGRIRTVEKAEVADQIPPKTAAWLDEYAVCADCDQLYWQGTHVGALAARVDRIRRMARS